MGRRQVTPISDKRSRPESARTPSARSRCCPATIKLVTTSGSKEYHGSIYYFKRHKQFNATDFFVNRNGTNNPPYRMTNVGFTWGGPLYIAKLMDRHSSKRSE